MISINGLTAELKETHNKKGLDGPVTRYNLNVGEIDNLNYGVWAVDEGRFAGIWEGEDWEIFVVIAGKGTFTTDEGEVHDLVPGTVCCMSPGTQGVWQITEPLRKIFIFPRESQERR